MYWFNQISLIYMESYRQVLQLIHKQNQFTKLLKHNFTEYKLINFFYKKIIQFTYIRSIR